MAGAEMGGMFDEDGESGSRASSKGSRRSNASAKKSTPSFHAEDAVAADDPWAGAEEKRGSDKSGSKHNYSRGGGGGSKRSASRREGSKISTTNKPLATIPEDEPFAAGWGDEDVFEPEPGSKSKSNKTSSSHRSHRSAAPEPEVGSHHNSKHSSHRSQRSAAPSPRTGHTSPVKGSLVSYHAPTVENVPDTGTPKHSAKHSHSHSKSRSRDGGSQAGSHASKSSFECKIDEAGDDFARPASYRSHRDPGHRSQVGSKDEAEAGLRTSHGLGAVDKIAKWSEGVPAPSAKALSQGLSQVGKGSHVSSRHSSRRSVEPVVGAWDNGLPPSEVSLGTGYGKKKKTSNAGEQPAVGGAEWDKRTSSGSSTRADLGVKPSSRRSSHRSGSPQVENNGQW